jgi:hypothetical protein
VTGAPLAQSACHCRSCQLASGAPWVAWIVVRRSDFAFIEGEPEAHRSSPPVVRTFCGRCGTPLTYRHDDSPETIDITTATLDRPELFAPTREIWIEHKLPWVKADPDREHFARTSRGSE